jgi:hypothetical protein
MIGIVDRRRFIASAAAAAGTLALPARVAAQASALDARSTAILDIARREVARAGDVLWRRDVAGIADFGAHSAVPRFHFANLENGTVRSYRVAHGTGSDPEHDGWLKWFSNEPGSNATSRGAYISWEWYTGKYGTSVRLGSLDPDNSNTYDRAIVMHSAEYCSQGPRRPLGPARPLERLLRAVPRTTSSPRWRSSRAGACSTPTSSTSAERPPSPDNGGGPSRSSSAKRG